MIKVSPAPSVFDKNNSVRFPVVPKTDPNFFFNNTVEQILSRMSVDEKIGQLLLIGFPQEKMDSKLANHIMQNKAGSFLIFKRNITSLEQLKNLNSSLVAHSFQHLRVPPLMAIDQEGGNVNRIVTNPKLPFLFHFGDLADTKFSYHYGYYTGQLLGSLGFNLNLAPVLDLADLDSNRFIALRSFGSDPIRTSQNGFAYSQGLISQKVIPTAKHFPGLGSATLDPHDTVIFNSSTLTEMDRTDLTPFKDFAKLGPHSAIMMSHMIYKGMDNSGQPASFSKYLMDDLLRKKIGFRGVIVTDDLHMKASSASITPSEAALRSLKAGSDLVMLSWSFLEQGKTFDRIKNAILRKELSIEEVNEKVRRILILKKFVYAKPSETDDRPSKTERILQEARTVSSVQVTAPELNSFSKRASLDSTSVYHLLKSVVDAKMKSIFFRPQLEQKKQLCLISDQKRLFNLIGKKDTNVFKGYHYPKHSVAKSLSHFLKSSQCDLFIITVETVAQARILNGVDEITHKKMVVINHVIPTILQNRSRYFSVLDLYGLNIQTDDILADKISEFTNMILRGQFHSASIDK
ncbi:MAG: glycoside hydrolase family 3 protein [Bdellovibrionaceae bacterium]|nr:glycoside hydrolase family 3 protein [Pseudobdellovibrionaceae bacterium]